MASSGGSALRSNRDQQSAIRLQPQRHFADGVMQFLFEEPTPRRHALGAECLDLLDIGLVVALCSDDEVGGSGATPVRLAYQSKPVGPVGNLLEPAGGAVGVIAHRHGGEREERHIVFVGPRSLWHTDWPGPRSTGPSAHSTSASGAKSATASWNSAPDARPKRGPCRPSPPVARGVCPAHPRCS